MKPKKMTYARECNYLGVEYGYAIGVGWCHIGTGLPITCLTQRELKALIKALERSAKEQAD